MKQQYVEMHKIGASEPPLFEFKWGPRADEEVSKREILQFVSKVILDGKIRNVSAIFCAQ